MKSLPYEVYLQIFTFVDRNELLKLATISKEWSPPALRLYYKEVYLYDYNTEKLKVLLNQDQCFKYGHLTETVNIRYEQNLDIYDYDYDDARMTLTMQEFQKFFSYLPNVKKLEFSGDDIELKYLDYLLDIDTSQCLTKLEDIDMEVYNFNNYDPSSLYYAVYYQFRSSLTQMLLNYEGSSILSDRYDGILNYISQFKKLAYLWYTNDIKLPVTIYDIQVACPTLTSLKFHDKKTTPSFQADSDIFYKYSDLKKLSIYFANIRKGYTEHIIKHLPKSIESLEIEIGGIDMYDWIYQVGIDNALKLVKLMNTLSSACLNFNPGIRYRRRHNNPNELDITTFFKILHIFKGDKKLRCTANFEGVNHSQSSMRFSGKDLTVNYGLDVDGLFTDNPVFPLAVPDKNVSTIGIGVIHRMRFIIDTVDTELLFKILKYSLSNCPHLQFFEFNGAGGRCLKFILSVCLEKYDKPERNYDLSTNSKENLKVAKIKKFIPSPELLGFFAVHSPNIHTFTFNSTDYYLHNFDGPPQDHTVDLRPFKTLKTVYFDLNLILNSS